MDDIEPFLLFINILLIVSLTILVIWFIRQVYNYFKNKRANYIENYIKHTVVDHPLGRVVGHYIDKDGNPFERLLHVWHFDRPTMHPSEVWWLTFRWSKTMKKGNLAYIRIAYNKIHHVEVYGRSQWFYILRGYPLRGYHVDFDYRDDV